MLDSGFRSFWPSLPGLCNGLSESGCEIGGVGGYHCRLGHCSFSSKPGSQLFGIGNGVSSFVPDRHAALDPSLGGGHGHFEIVGDCRPALQGAGDGLSGRLLAAAHGHRLKRFRPEVSRGDECTNRIGVHRHIQIQAETLLGVYSSAVWWEAEILIATPTAAPGAACSNLITSPVPVTCLFGMRTVKLMLEFSSGLEFR